MLVKRKNQDPEDQIQEKIAGKIADLPLALSLREIIEGILGEVDREVLVMRSPEDTKEEREVIVEITGDQELRLL